MFSDLAIQVARMLPAPVKRAIHKINVLDKSVRRVYGSAVQGNTFQIAGGPMRGMRLAGSEHTSHAHIGGTYEQDVQEAIDRNVRPGDICYDLGASIGYMTLLMARKAKHVYAFEPAPHAVAEIRRHLDANGLANVTIIESPVSGSVRDVEFAVTDAAYGSAIAQDNKWPVIRLRTTTLDLFAANHPRPDFVKIDIEGEEGAALETATSILSARQTRFCVELHGSEVAKSVFRTFARYGYSLSGLDGSPARIPDEVVPGEFHVIARPDA